MIIRSLGTRQVNILARASPAAGTRYIVADSHSLAPQMVACTSQLSAAHSAVAGINARRVFRFDR
jgi:hypothetical protein